MRSFALTVTLVALAAACFASNWTVVASFDGPYPSQGYGIEAYGNYLYCVGSNMAYISKITTTGSQVNTIPLFMYCYDLDFDGTYFWVVQTDHQCRRYTSTGSTLGSFSIGSIIGNGIAYDGTYIWVQGGPTSTQYIYRMSTTGSIYSSFPAQGNYMGAIDYAAGYFWSMAGPSSSTAYKLTTAGSVVDSFAGPVTPSYGSSFDGTYFWTTNYGNGWVYKMQDVEDVAPASLGRVKALYR